MTKEIFRLPKVSHAVWLQTESRGSRSSCRCGHQGAEGPQVGVRLCVTFSKEMWSLVMGKVEASVYTGVLLHGPIDQECIGAGHVLKLKLSGGYRLGMEWRWPRPM